MSKRRHNFGTKRVFFLIPFYISCPYRAEVTDTAVCMPDCARCQNRENTHTHRQTHRQDKYCNPRACAPRVNNLLPEMHAFEFKSWNLIPLNCAGTYILYIYIYTEPLLTDQTRQGN